MYARFPFLERLHSAPPDEEALLALILTLQISTSPQDLSELCRAISFLADAWPAVWISALGQDLIDALPIADDPQWEQDTLGAALVAHPTSDALLSAWLDATLRSGEVRTDRSHWLEQAEAAAHMSEAPEVAGRLRDWAQVIDVLALEDDHDRDPEEAPSGAVFAGRRGLTPTQRALLQRGRRWLSQGADPLRREGGRQ